MSNSCANNKRNRRNNNFRNRKNKSYYENCSWSTYNPNYQYQKQNRSREWFWQNWQQMRSESFYIDRTCYNYGNYRQSQIKHWHTGWRTGQSKHMFDELSQEVQIKHISKFKEYLEDDEKIYLNFEGLSLSESSYVYNLHNLYDDSNAYYDFKMKEAVSGLYDILKVAESKVHLEVICEECNDQSLRNVIYTKVLKKSNDKSIVKNSDLDLECNENIKLEESITEVKMIMKEDLYRESVGDVKDDIPLENDSNRTQGPWIKCNETLSEEHDANIPAQNNLNKRMSKLLKTYSTPVESNKGRRMMEKMGWNGGALGVNGEGIIDPIIPNVTSKLRAGIGHSHEPKLKKLKIIPKNDKKITDIKILRLIFKTNVLKQILDFVCDDELTEICFDCALSKAERQKIHHVVEHLRSQKDIDYDSMEQISLISEIQHNMLYILEHESEGKGINRKLYLYKSAPENIYLITPKDLNEESDESVDKFEHTKIDEPSILPGQNMPTENMENSSIDSKGDDNSSSGDCKNKTDSIKSVSRREFLKESLTSYVKEFCEDESMNELRFLGQFNALDSAFINWFMADLAHNLQNRDAENRKSTKDLDILYVNEYYDFKVYEKEREGSILYVLRKMEKTAKFMQKV